MTHDLKAERAGLGRRLDVRRGTVDMTHGSGGRASAQLIGELFAKHLTNEWLAQGHDGAVMPPIVKPVAVSCDAHVVKPLFFPGGDIGRLAVTGTVNDVAMCGAKPLWLSAAFILEEGFPLADLEKIVISMAETAMQRNVSETANGYSKRAGPHTSNSCISSSLRVYRGYSRNSRPPAVPLGKSMSSYTISFCPSLSEIRSISSYRSKYSRLR